jgi:8-oxo-dGTP pyrophosphatase MutT (NUDIX family)
MRTVHDVQQSLARLDVNVAIVSAIIEREHHGEKEILVQTRWKPERDPQYSGTLEIPAGGIHPYENVYDAVKREVLEETGLRVTGFSPDIPPRSMHPRRTIASPLSPSAVSNSSRAGSHGWGLSSCVRWKMPNPCHNTTKHGISGG